jgi:hypothetical protein
MTGMAAQQMPSRIAASPANSNKLALAGRVVAAESRPLKRQSSSQQRRGADLTWWLIHSSTSA